MKPKEMQHNRVGKEVNEGVILDIQRSLLVLQTFCVLFVLLYSTQFLDQTVIRVLSGDGRALGYEDVLAGKAKGNEAEGGDGEV